MDKSFKDVFSSKRWNSVAQFTAVIVLFNVMAIYVPSFEALADQINNFLPQAMLALVAGYSVEEVFKQWSNGKGGTPTTTVSIPTVFDNTPNADPEPAIKYMGIKEDPGSMTAEASAALKEL